MLEEKGERLYSIMGGCRELKTRTPAAKNLGEGQALLREVIRNTKSEGLKLETQLKSLGHERRTSDSTTKPELPVCPEIVNILGWRKTHEKEHFSKIFL